MFLIDTHAHLDMLKQPVDQVLQQAEAADVRLIISVADTVQASQKAVNLAKQHPNVKAAVGIHPHEAGAVAKQSLEALATLARQPEVVAIGEIGLDFYKLYSSREQQQEVFKRQLDLAKELDLPVIIHCRNAYEEVAEALAPYLPHPFLIHCFTGSLSQAVVFLSLGCLLAFNGIVTFKQADELREVVRQTPLEKMVLETDTPFLTPHPYRGKPNEPAYLYYVAEKVAEVKQVDLTTVAKQTTHNANSFFRLKLNL